MTSLPTNNQDNRVVTNSDGVDSNLTNFIISHTELTTPATPVLNPVEPPLQVPNHVRLPLPQSIGNENTPSEYLGGYEIDYNHSNHSNDDSNSDYVTRLMDTHVQLVSSRRFITNVDPDYNNDTIIIEVSTENSPENNQDITGEEGQNQENDQNIQNH